MFISFLDQGDQGNMVKRLSMVMNDLKVRQYRLDKGLPDLSKFSELLGVIRMTLNELKVQEKEDTVEESGKTKKKNKKNRKHRVAAKKNGIPKKAI